MKLGLARVLALAVALALAACATGPRLTPPTSAIPDLRGTWKGTWGGTPLALLVIDQQGTVPVGGVTLGPWSLSGDALPALSGVLTFQSAGAAVSVNARGRFGDWHAPHARPRRLHAERRADRAHRADARSTSRHGDVAGQLGARGPGRASPPREPSDRVAVIFARPRRCPGCS